MNIWLITIGEPLPLEPDVRKYRTAMLADKLIELGHTVRWWTGAFEHQRKVMQFTKDQEVSLSDRLALQVLRGCGYRRNVSLARYINHQIVALKFRIQSKKFAKPNVIIASMPDHLLAYEAARYARKNNIPFLVDIRDLWPDIFLDRFKKMGMYGLGKLVLTRDFMLLTSLLKSAYALTAVSRGYLQWGLDKVRRSQGPFDRVFYHGYKASAKRATNSNKRLDISPWLKGKKDQKLFIFIGTFGVSYELELVLDAAKRFDRLGKDDICFVLAGTGEKSDLIAKKASGLQNVVLPGWIGQNEINALLKRAYAGLVPCRMVENTASNKPFEYLSAGLPLINSLEGEMAKLVDQHRIGLNYLPGDLEGLCLCIERLSTDFALCDEMSQNASKFFNAYGDADKTYSEYSTYIEKIVQHRKKNITKRNCNG